MQKNGQSKCVRAGQWLCAALCMGILFGGMLAHILMPDAAAAGLPPIMGRGGVAAGDLGGSL